MIDIQGGDVIDILGACAEMPAVDVGEGDFIDADIMARCSGPVPVDTLLAMQLHKDMVQLRAALEGMAKATARLAESMGQMAQAAELWESWMYDMEGADPVEIEDCEGGGA